MDFQVAFSSITTHGTKELNVVRRPLKRAQNQNCLSIVVSFGWLG
jgi:hypothetical protein